MGLRPALARDCFPNVNLSWAVWYLVDARYADFATSPKNRVQDHAF